MSEVSGQTASSLALVEKKTQRPGGCVAILFQLFDWNRKLAKKKLFSKKLLPPVRLRKLSNKFGGDEKQPKLRLIADENSGGFPHGKKSNNGGCAVDSEQSNDSRTPGLVARLMGLETMPTAKPKMEKNGRDLDGDKSQSVEKIETKQEIRPQKLQRTGESERKAVTRFGNEAMQLKNVLAKSRKQNQKLVAPLKSPRNVPGRNASRLIGAATRILEPGLQRNRAKCSLEYHPSSLKADLLMEEAKDLRPVYFQSSCKVPNEQSSSCQNCGQFLDAAEEKVPMLHIVHPSGQVSERSNPRLPMLVPQRQSGTDHEAPQSRAVFGMEARQHEATQSRAVFGTEARQHEAPQSRAVFGTEARQQHCTQFLPEKKFLNRDYPSQQLKLQKDSPSGSLRHKVYGQNQTPHGRERLPSRSRTSKLPSSRVGSTSTATDETKDFVALNQTLSVNSRPRMPVKGDSYWLDPKNKGVVDRRKKRPMNSSRQNEGSSSPSSSAKPANSRLDAASAKESTKTDSSSSGHAVVPPFTFKSQMKRKAGIQSEVELRKDQVTETEVSSWKNMPLTGDSLGALLEQKLKELTRQEDDDDCALGETLPKKTTAMILQELISALTTERPYQHDDLPRGQTTMESYSAIEGQQSKRSTSMIFRAQRKSNRSTPGNLPTSEHLSPGSVLETCFSNESCCSSSLDDSSRCNHEEVNILEAEVDLSDLGSSPGMAKFYRDSVHNLLDTVSEVFKTLNLEDVYLKGSKLNHAQEVILNAELIFGRGFSMNNFVLNQLDMLASVMCRNFIDICALDIKEGKNQVKNLVFDCFIEYLESRFNRYSNSGFSAWSRLPQRMKTEMLICEIVEEVGRWAALAGLFPNELIEHEMSHSLGKWTDFELEEFETGAEIDQQILQTLVSDAVLEFVTDCNTK